MTDGTATILPASSASPSYLLFLALAVTAVVAVLVLYLVVRRRLRAPPDDQADKPLNAPLGTSLLG